MVGVLVAMASVTAVVHTLNRSDAEHREGAILDPLTGLLNRTSLERRFAELAEQAALSGGHVSLIALDLDHFKSINDRYGHSRGDDVLREVAYLLRKELRSFELIYRLGGEELLIVLPGVTAPEAHEVAERLRVTIAEARPAGLEVTASLGVAQTLEGEADFASVFADADAALYRAKDEGRNLVRVADRRSGLVAGAHPRRRDDEAGGMGVEAA
jgi:diguanylate cyclase (GGDEF)-like protein